MPNDDLERIADQLRRAYDGEAWHGTPLRRLLSDVAPSRAAAHPVVGAHSIWELVHHITAWHRIVTRRLAGEVVDPTPSEDWPAVGGTEPSDWIATLAALENSVEQLAEAVLRLEPSALQRPVAGRKADTYVTLHGVVQHTLYHAGQIALLKRAAT
jgi:uncharacterized damage-inducible protein DinB